MSGNGQGPDRTRPADYRRLLNFLAKNSSICEKAILQSSQVPEFAAVRQILNQRARSTVEEFRQELTVSTIETDSGSLSSALTELIEQVELQISEQQINEEPVSVSMMPQGGLDFLGRDEILPVEEMSADPGLILDSSTVVASRRGFLDQTARMLELWFGAGDENEDEFEEPIETVDDEVVQSLVEDPAELLRQLEQIAQSSSPPVAPQPGLKKAAKPERASVRRRRHWLRPCMIPMNNGTRKEVFPNNASVTKDALGRVKEVRSQEGIRIQFGYDSKGHLVSFVRSLPSGRVHSRASKDRHGVVVRDERGRVKAQGDNIAVDPRGCVSIRKLDGQFWCVDLVRGIHIERRILEDMNGSWHSLTALMAYDGFRMATRFQALNQSYRRFGDWLAPSSQGTFRFYGRD
ncbi:MAG: RHS repeat protein, partial [Cyanobacteria bacterium HKST-UBA02]|nr:RHS repeat protein [Cyanobacteria bacterium HKST-UBA02]